MYIFQFSWQIEKWVWVLPQTTCTMISFLSGILRGCSTYVTRVQNDFHFKCSIGKTWTSITGFFQMIKCHWIPELNWMTHWYSTEEIYCTYFDAHHTPAADTGNHIMCTPMKKNIFNLEMKNGYNQIFFKRNLSLRKLSKHVQYWCMLDQYWSLIA